MQYNNSQATPKQDSSPTFSIIAPTYNRQNFIYKTIESLLYQTYENFEIIIVDDGSTDNTKAEIKKFHDKRIRYFYKKNGERGAARNYGAEEARGRYLNFFDSDDLSYPNHLATAHEIITSCKNLIVFHLNYEVKRPNGEIIRKGPGAKNPDQIKLEMLKNNFISINGVFIETQTFRKHRFNEDRRLAVAEDWALWLTLESTFGIKCLPNVTSAIIEHASRSITEFDSDKILAREQCLIEYVKSDNAIVARHGNRLNHFYARRHVFAALALSLDKKYRKALSELGLAATISPKIIASREFLAVLPKLVPYKK
jgi:glycosyltransferase involved in cell wall biosynthesis